MAKPNYSFEKRQREIAKKKQKEEKAAKKRDARGDKAPTSDVAADTDSAAPAQQPE